MFQIPCFHQVNRLKLNLMTINITSNNVNCINGVAISIDGVAQVKVNADTDASLQLAVQNFLGMKEHQINGIMNETLEGHQRAIISTMSVENVYQDRVLFAEKVRDCATGMIQKMCVAEPV